MMHCTKCDTWQAEIPSCTPCANCHRKEVAALLALLERCKEEMLTVGQLTGTALFILNHGDLDKNSHALTYQLLNIKAEKREALERDMNTLLAERGEGK